MWTGSLVESGPTTPLPDKKLLVFILDRLQKYVLFELLGSVLPCTAMGIFYWTLIGSFISAERTPMGSFRSQWIRKRCVSWCTVHDKGACIAFILKSLSCSFLITMTSLRIPWILEQ